jgi:hypothetical protein
VGPIRHSHSATLKSWSRLNVCPLAGVSAFFNSFLVSSTWDST